MPSCKIKFIKKGQDNSRAASKVTPISAIKNSFLYGFEYLKSSFHIRKIRPFRNNND